MKNRKKLMILKETDNNFKEEFQAEKQEEFVQTDFPTRLKTVISKRKILKHLRCLKITKDR